MNGGWRAFTAVCRKLCNSACRRGSESRAYEITHKSANRRFHHEAFAVDPARGVIYSLANPTEITRFNLTGASLEPYLQPDCFNRNPGVAPLTPQLVRLDSQGNLIIVMAASYSSKGLLKCDAEGQMAALSKGLNNVVDLAVDPHGRLWVISVTADAFSQSRLLKLSGEDFAVLATYEIPGLHGITADTHGNIYVSQWLDEVTGDHKVLKLDQEGNILAEWGHDNGAGPGQFSRPEMLAADSLGNLYVYNANWRLVKLNAAGEFIAEFNMSEWLQHGMVIVREPSPASVPPAAGLSTASTPATALLEGRPWPPTDTSLLNPSVYPGPEALPASGPEPAEDQVRDLLEAYLTVEFEGDIEKVRAGLALFDSEAARQKIPHPGLRAGFVGLLNTLAEPAIETVLSAQTREGQPLFIRVTFGELQPNVVATVRPVSEAAGEERLEIVFNDQFRAENPFLFTRTFAHEPLHQDNLNGVYEEGLITALDTLVYLHQLARHPELAQAGTWLARFHNTNALARLNSGQGSRLGLLATNGNQPILPGSTVDFVSFWDRYRDNPVFEATPGNALLAAYLARLTPTETAVCDGRWFDELLLHCLDQAAVPLSDTEILSAAQALRLAISPP